LAAVASDTTTLCAFMFLAMAVAVFGFKMTLDYYSGTIGS
jgi:hypothetical protein